MREDWQQRLEPLSDENLAELARERELGELNFASVVEKLNVIRRLVQALGLEPDDELPSAVVTQVTAQLDQVVTIISQIQAFTLAQDQAATQRTNLETQVENYREWFVQNVRPHLRGTETDISASKAQIEDALIKATDASTEIDELLNRLRRAAGEAGATELSSYYQRQSTNHETQAGRFLIGAVAAFVFTLALGIVLFVVAPISITSTSTVAVEWTQLTRSLIARLFFLGLSTYVLAFAVRNYRINRHLQTTNEEKRNALNTYPLFVAAAPTAETENIVTSAVATSVFGATDTGYLDGSNDRTIIENAPGLTALLTSRPPAQT